jgi:hypothetical protein
MLLKNGSIYRLGGWTGDSETRESSLEKGSLACARDFASSLRRLLSGSSYIDSEFRCKLIRKIFARVCFQELNGRFAAEKKEPDPGFPATAALAVAGVEKGVRSEPRARESVTKLLTNR